MQFRFHFAVYYKHSAIESDIAKYAAASLKQYQLKG